MDYHVYMSVLLGITEDSHAVSSVMLRMEHHQNQLK